MQPTALISALRDICGPNGIITDLTALRPYQIDWRERYHGNAIALALPQNTEELIALVKLCQQQQIAIIPQGGNTSTCGGAVPLSNYYQPQLIINLKRMKRILNLDRVNNSLTVEAGCSLTQVQQAAQAAGLYFPLSLASEDSCQIGGNLATNAGGIHVLKYGMMRELTLGLEAILPDGSLLSCNTALRKNNTYLDLKQLLIGSEGTLGIISQATLRLFPPIYDYFTFSVAVNSLSQALCLLECLRANYSNNVAAFEILKAETIELMLAYHPDERLLLRAPWQLIVELEITTEFSLERFYRLLDELPLDLNQLIVATTPTERKAIWQIRELVPLVEKQHGYALKHDIALPLSALEEFLAVNMPKLLACVPHGYFSIFGHLGDGNLHYNFGIKGASRHSISQLEQQISPLVYADVVALGGSIAAEHGIGQTKVAALPTTLNSINYQLLRQIKNMLDPANLFNPGKIFPL
jgi:FAD/FMN-containing dehydrogenase